MAECLPYHPGKSVELMYLPVTLTIINQRSRIAPTKHCHVWHGACACNSFIYAVGEQSISAATGQALFRHILMTIGQQLSRTILNRSSDPRKRGWHNLDNRTYCVNGFQYAYALRFTVGVCLDQFVPFGILTWVWDLAMFLPNLKPGRGICLPQTLRKQTN